MSPDEDGVEQEWLETDGLGGFAMGTSRGWRTRRYHGLLQVARRPPAERTMLVPAVEASVRLGDETVALSSHRFAPGVTHPDGAERIRGFSVDPWPTWVLDLPDGRHVVHEVFVPHGIPAVVLSWRCEAGRDAAGGAGEAMSLVLRPFVCSRDFHALEQQNHDLRPDPVFECGRIELSPYAGQLAVAMRTDGRYVHAPVWYRRFVLEEELARGLDHEEDLWSPGTIEVELSEEPAALVLFAPELAPSLAKDRRTAAEIRDALATVERARRASFPDRLARAGEAYLVRRGEGSTIIAGYPWFGDWGRDTLVALRGLCLAADRLDDAGSILREWSAAVSEGMLPNRFPDRGEAPEHNAVDASLWYVVACGDYLKRRGSAVDPGEREVLLAACRAIVRGYRSGTRFGIRVDPTDGLVAAGLPGTQLTWMDAKVGDHVITPRIGKPVEVQALWVNALTVLQAHDGGLEGEIARVLASFGRRFVSDERAWLADVVDVDHVPGAIDETLRPNQVFALGGLPVALVEGAAARSALDVVERQLWTPVGLRSLAANDSRYVARYEGDALQRDAAYHQGTVWPWLLGAFVEAFLSVRGNTHETRAMARARFVGPLEAHLDVAGIGHVSEIFDAEPPHTPRGCPFQAWSVGELLRLRRLLAPE